LQPLFLPPQSNATTRFSSRECPDRIRQQIVLHRGS